ncbi:unnamed protein product, partial [Ostreobium quekettii]
GLICECRVHIGQSGGKAKGDQTSGDARLAALAMVQQARSSKPGAEAAENILREAWAKVDPEPRGYPRQVDLVVVAAIGWAAATSGCVALARECSRRAELSQ